jgi:hypothetical protein
MYKEIETKNGIYKVKTPTGAIGAQNFAIISKSLPKNSETDKDGNAVMSPMDEERLYKGFEEWANKVLKRILVEKDSVHKFDEMPGEDQWILFMAMISLIEVDGEELFRFV